MLNNYTLIARFFPSLLSLLPLFILWFFLSEITELNNIEKYLLNLRFFGEIGFSFVIIYLYSHIIRWTSKFFENKYFINYKGFPTTYFMTFEDNTYSKSFKNKYREKIKEIFDLPILNEYGEKKNIEEARRQLNEATNMVLVKLGKGKLVHKHNIWYGFSRNLIGGVIYSLLFCINNFIVGLCFLHNTMLIVISSILFFIYLMVFIFHKIFLVQNAEAYAKKLISEFMAL